MIEVNDEQDTLALGRKLGRLLRGGEIIELVGDVGAGKTMLTRGIAEGMGVEEVVQSPSFTISRLYSGRGDNRLAHYDFYRLKHAGIMSDELADAIDSKDTSIIIEWSDTVKDILPRDRLVISISTNGENRRIFNITASGTVSRKLLKELE